MRYLVLSILTLSLNALNAGQGVSKPDEPAKTPAQESPANEQARMRKMTMPNQVDQHDTTDIFAIQLDSSEVEQDQEYDELQNESKELQDAKKAEQK